MQRKRTKKTPATAEQPTEALSAIAKYLGSRAPFQTKVLRSLDLIAETLAADRISLRLVERGSGLLRTVCRAGRLALATDRRNVTHSGRGLAGRVFEIDDMVIVDDYRRSPFALQVFTEVGIRSAVGVPVYVEDTCAGVLTLYSTKPAHFDAQPIRLLEGFQAAIGALVTEARLREQIAKEHETNERQDAFMAVATHELRTPMTTILGYSELLMARKTLEGDGERWIAAINESAREAAAIVDGIATAWELQHNTVPDETLFDCFQVTLKVVEMMSSSVPSHTIKMGTLEEPVPMIGDPKRLQQVLQVVIENAVKYSPARKEIIVTVEVDKPRGRVVLAVADQGLGIAPPLQPYVFAAFYRIDGQVSPVRGAGLGLHIARVNVESMGGTIWIDDSAPTGTTVKFSIPGLRSQQGQISASPGAHIGNSFGLSQRKVRIKQQGGQEHSRRRLAA